MDALLAGRIQITMSMAFHMLFAAAGVGMPLLTLIAEGLWLWRRRPEYLTLARTWARVTGVLFAMGAVSGTALAFQMGLLWPRFMERFGAAVGPAFSLEGFAFFLEAIFLGLYLYGWNRLSPWAHWAAGLGIVLSVAASSVLVVSANAWMQNPVAVRQLLTDPQRFEPLQALFGNPRWPVMALHSTLATYAATGFAVAGLYAVAARRRTGTAGPGSAAIQAALHIALAVGGVAALALPVTGDVSARMVAEQQPAKLAAMEGLFETRSRAPLTVGGWPDVEGRRIVGGLELPSALSLMAYRDPDATVTGLDRVEPELWPNVPLTRTAFQVMVGAGLLMLASAGWYWLAAYRRRSTGRPLTADRLLMAAVAASGPLGYVALEAGWVAAEVGRQPWIVYGVMRTAEAVTPATGVSLTLATFAALYGVLLAATVAFLRRITRGARAEAVPQTGAVRETSRPARAPATAVGVGGGP